MEKFRSFSAEITKIIASERRDRFLGRAVPCRAGPVGLGQAGLGRELDRVRYTLK